MKTTGGDVLASPTSLDRAVSALHAAAQRAGFDITFRPGYLDRRRDGIDWVGLRLAAEADGRPAPAPYPHDCVRAVNRDHRAALKFADAIRPPWSLRARPSLWVERPTFWWRVWLDTTFGRVTWQQVGTCHAMPGAGLVEGVAYEVTIPATAVDRVIRRLGGAR